MFSRSGRPEMEYDVAEEEVEAQAGIVRSSSQIASRTPHLKMHFESEQSQDTKEEEAAVARSSTIASRKNHPGMEKEAKGVFGKFILPKTKFNFKKDEASTDPAFISKRVKDVIRMKKNKEAHAYPKETSNIKTAVEVAAEIVERLAQQESDVSSPSNEKIVPQYVPVVDAALLKTLTDKEKEILQQLPCFVPPFPFSLPGLLDDVIVQCVKSSDVSNYESRNALNFLENSMYEFYQPFWKVNTLMTKEQIRLNGLYAIYSKEDDKWYRGVVKEFFQREDVEYVEMIGQLIDHRRLITLTIECIFPLRKEYTRMPYQAAHARISIDEKTDFELIEEAIDKFREDVEGKQMQVMIADYKVFVKPTLVVVLIKRDGDIL